VHESIVEAVTLGPTVREALSTTEQDGQQEV